MSFDPLPPLDPALDRLLESERTAIAIAPADALERVWSRLALPVVASAQTRAAPKGAAEGLTRVWPLSRALSVAALTFVAGGVVGGAIVANLQKPLPARVVYVDRPVPPPSGSAAALPTPESLPEAPAEEAPGVDRPGANKAQTNAVMVRATPAPSGSASSLTAERVLLDEARAALADSDTSRALALIDEHSRRFAHPVLAEEREALAIQALVIAGRYPEARDRAARFRVSSPNSLFLPAVEASVGSIP